MDKEKLNTLTCAVLLKLAKEHRVNVPPRSKKANIIEKLLENFPDGVPPNTSGNGAKASGKRASRKVAAATVTTEEAAPGLSRPAAANTRATRRRKTEQELDKPKEIGTPAPEGSATKPTRTKSAGQTSSQSPKTKTTASSQSSAKEIAGTQASPSTPAPTTPKPAAPAEDEPPQASATAAVTSAPPNTSSPSRNGASAASPPTLPTAETGEDNQAQSGAAHEPQEVEPVPEEGVNSSAPSSLPHPQEHPVRHGQASTSRQSCTGKQPSPQPEAGPSRQLRDPSSSSAPQWSKKPYMPSIGELDELLSEARQCAVENKEISDTLWRTQHLAWLAERRFIETVVELEGYTEARIQLEKRIARMKEFAEPHENPLPSEKNGRKRRRGEDGDADEGEGEGTRPRQRRR